jgi:TrmH family RNA methyltransferase
MIPLHKLSSLPRHQRLRKAAKIISDGERRLLAAGYLEAGAADYLRAVAELLAQDEAFSPAQAAALKAASTILATNAAGTDETRRALNTVYHLLLAETGRCPSDWDFIEPEGALDASMRRPFAGMQVYLEDIRSPFNVGAMFRTAESFGAAKLWLSPLCADPRHKRAQRTAMGCADVLPWERLVCEPFANSKADSKTGGGDAGGVFGGAPLFALETGGIPLAEFPFPAGGILIAGSEELGVSPQALAAADASLGRVSIPTRGAKGSLNVSVAFGIVMQAWAGRLGEYYR